MDISIDYEQLRKDLIDYFGTAMEVNPIAMINLVDVENATPEQLVQIAVKNSFDLSIYEIKDKTL